jgi:hypothetical protein
MIDKVAIMKPCVLTNVTTACTKTQAAAREALQRDRPVELTSPECHARGSASPLSKGTHSVLKCSEKHAHP